MAEAAVDVQQKSTTNSVVLVVLHATLHASYTLCHDPAQGAPDRVRSTTAIARHCYAAHLKTLRGHTLFLPPADRTAML